MAGSPRTYYRNWTSTDNTMEEIGSVGGVVLTPAEVGFDAPSGKAFVEWNTARNGSGTSVIAGQTSYVEEYLYAIWVATPAVEITYNGNTIATMSDTGTKTLLTADSYCENNIVVNYTKPAAPAPNLQAKTNIAPTTSSQTITADSGYDGLSSVQINAMPSGSARTPTTSVYASTSYYIDEWGTLMISASGSQQITPIVSAGYVSSGTAGTITAYSNDTFDLTSDGYAFDGTVDDYEEEEEGGGGA